MASLSEILRLEIKHPATGMHPDIPGLWIGRICNGTLYANDHPITRACAGSEEELRKFIADDMLKAVFSIDKKAKERLIGFEVMKELQPLMIEIAIAEGRVSSFNETIEILENRTPLLCMIAGFFSFLAGCLIGRI